MKMRGKRRSGWYAACGCYLAGKGKEFFSRTAGKREVQEEIDDELCGD